MRASLRRCDCVLVLLLLVSLVLPIEGLAAPDVPPATPGGTTRTYYIAAEEIEWNYILDGRDMMMTRAFHSYARAPSVFQLIPGIGLVTWTIPLYCALQPHFGMEPGSGLWISNCARVEGPFSIEIGYKGIIPAGAASRTLPWLASGGRWPGWRFPPSVHMF